MQRTVIQRLQLARPVVAAAKAALPWTFKDVLTSSDQYVPTLNPVSFSHMFSYTFTAYLSFAQSCLLLDIPPQCK